jgi:hypothetical protein
MPYMVPPPGFEPDVTAKQLLLYVKKHPKTIGSTKLHGLVQDSYSDIATPFFYLAVVLELVGLWFILVEIPSLGYGLIGAIALFLLDILFALWYHQKTKTICICENSCTVLSVIENNHILREAREANYKSEMRRSKRIAFIPALLIVTIAVVKIVTFYMLVSRSADGIPDTVVFFIITSYAIVAFIHLRYTGYAIYHWFARSHYWKHDEREFNRVQPERLRARPRPEYFVTRESLMPSRAGNHELEEIARIDLLIRKVVLGASVSEKFQAYLRQNLPLADGPVDNEVANRLKVEINENMNVPVLHDDLRLFLTNELHIGDELVQEFTKEGRLYRLKATGLLLDAQLSELANPSPSTGAKNAIALHGLKLQMDILGILPGAAHA